MKNLSLNTQDANILSDILITQYNDISKRISDQKRKGFSDKDLANLWNQKRILDISIVALKK